MKVIHGGKQFQIKDSLKTYHGTLYCVLGDTPAAQLLGGFNEGVSMAKKPCRTCNITSDELGNCLSENEVALRNELEYNDQCDALDHLDRVSKCTRKYWSKEYGITKRSILASIPEFEVTKSHACFIGRHCEGGTTSNPPLFHREERIFYFAVSE
jgi:hypothetical protein